MVHPVVGGSSIWGGIVASKILSRSFCVGSGVIVVCGYPYIMYL